MEMVRDVGMSNQQRGVEKVPSHSVSVIVYNHMQLCPTCIILLYLSLLDKQWTTGLQTVCKKLLAVKSLYSNEESFMESALSPWSPGSGALCVCDIGIMFSESVVLHCKKEIVTVIADSDEGIKVIESAYLCVSSI